ncbi:phosphotransferase [Actinomyces johnsonii]|uniref:Phosphotransferase n=3 Tax=Actinomyces johnsonii TaxID=544581 RepID=A0A508AE67_9ACTO|nr:phosphotransferase [Actinomyces johnsonii]KAA8743614.1 phosphotransferase [Actinomyces johnsonii]TQD44092.1 phosphotransferase [Actinomyces johnsonii]
MSQPPQSPDAPGSTDVDGRVDDLTDEAASDVERAAAPAGDDHDDHGKQQAEHPGGHDDDYRAPVVVAPLPGASAGPPRNSRPTPETQSATHRPRHSALALAAMASVAVAGLNPARLALPQSETPERHITGVIDTQGRHWEVHEARTDAVGASLEAEAEVLRRIGRVVDDGRLSFDVPRVSGSLRQQGAHIQVRSHVEGKPIPVEALRPGPGMSAGLGKALGEIHELDMSVISEAGMPVYDAEEVRRRWLSLLDDAAATGKTPPTLLGRWEQALEDTALWRFRPAVVHGDLAEENVLVAGGTVVAVRGWSQAHVGDPAEDLAWVYSSAPVDCLDSIEDAYDIARSEGVDRHLRERAELVSELSLARWLLHGVRTGDKPVINDAVAMLEDLAAQVGDAPLVEPAAPRLAPVPGEREPAEPDAITNPVAMVRVDDEDD